MEDTRKKTPGSVSNLNGRKKKYIVYFNNAMYIT
jgi:hypothetical protein